MRGLSNIVDPIFSDRFCGGNGLYSGKLVKFGCPHVRGKMKYDNGKKFVWSWNNGVPNDVEYQQHITTGCPMRWSTNSRRIRLPPWSDNSNNWARRRLTPPGPCALAGWGCRNNRARCIVAPRQPMLPELCAPVGWGCCNNRVRCITAPSEPFARPKWGCRNNRPRCITASPWAPQRQPSLLR